jgi:sugar (pentulose or hexulose) kinase
MERCSHETGAAVAAVPAQGEEWAYISSGTWSLLGVELDGRGFSYAELAAEAETQGQMTRCIYESLGLLFRRTLDEIESVTGKHVARLHIVGGSSQRTLLNRFAANATGRRSGATHSKHSLNCPELAQFLRFGVVPMRMETIRSIRRQLEAPVAEVA